MSKLLRHSFWNFLGSGIPILVAVVSIPFVIKGFGVERFGMLTLIWALAGYFGLFDLGIGRAVTYFLASALANRADDEVPEIVLAGILATFAFGVLSAAIMLGFGSVLVADVVRPPLLLADEVAKAFAVVAIGVPIITVGIALRGVLEGYQRFDVVNFVRVPLGIVTFVCPLFVMSTQYKLVWATIILIVARALVAVVYLQIIRTIAPEAAELKKVSLSRVWRLVSYGKWLTLTNIVGPILVSMDRFVISAILGAAAVTYYVTPMEVLSRTTIFASALSFALFPGFATLFVRDSVSAYKIYSISLRALSMLLFPLYLALVAMSSFGLQLWLGGEFSQKSTLVMQILAIGVFINSVGHIPFTLVQSSGHPDWSAKLHVIELIVYSIVIYVLTTHFGIAGTATAWLLRISIDLLAHLVFAARIFHLKERPTYVAVLLAEIVLLLILVLMGADLPGRVILISVSLILWALSPLILFSFEERRDILSRILRLVPRKNVTSIQHTTPRI